MVHISGEAYFVKLFDAQIQIFKTHLHIVDLTRHIHVHV